MADIFAHARKREGPDVYPLMVVILSDHDHPHNIRIVSRRDGTTRLCTDITITLDVCGNNLAMADTCRIAGKNIVEQMIAGPVLFVAMTGEEFERRHGCRSSTPA